MNCPKCKDELNVYDRHGQLRVAYLVQFYGGDRTRDAEYCPACALTVLTDELVERAAQFNKALALAEDIGRLL